MRKLVLLTAAGFAFPATATEKAVPVTLTASQQSAVETAVLAKFTDPENAQFTKILATLPVAGDGSVVTVCGLIKKAIGNETTTTIPYIGKLILTGEKFEVTGTVDENAHRTVYRSCAEHNISLLM